MSVIAMRFIVAGLLLLGLGWPATAKTLNIYFIDVEGGQATLIVTPAGESLLIDAGYARNGRDSTRILSAAADADIKHIDYLLITHFHPDHAGGVPDLTKAISLGTFIDYGQPLGTDRMALGVFRNYEAVRDKHPHLIPYAGGRLPLRSIDVDVVSADGHLLQQPIPGAGQQNPACASLEEHTEDGTENYRSIGVRVQFGAFSFLDLGDLSGNTLGRLACPRNLVGEVSAYLVPHHANYDANVPAVLAAIEPRIAILNNGPNKGAAPDSLATLHGQQGLDVWQLHTSGHASAVNAPDPFIANLDDGQTSYWLKLTAEMDGSFAMLNSRTGWKKTYAAAPRPGGGS